MKRPVIDLRSQAPLLNIVSYGRGGRMLTPTQRAYVARTVRHVPEVVVKVSGGARTLAGVQRHMGYIEKKGVLGLETDRSTRAGGDHFAPLMVKDWDLDVEALKHYSTPFRRGKPPKLVHNIVFSMPTWHLPGESAEGRSKACSQRMGPSASLRHGTPHRRRTPARPRGCEGSERARRAFERQKSNATILADPVCREPA